MLEKIFKNIVSLGLISFIVFTIAPLQIKALSNVKVYTGDNEYGEDTNVVIEFTLTQGVVAGEGGDFQILFDADDNDSTSEGFLTGITTDSVHIYNETDDVLHGVESGNSWGTFFGLTVTDDLMYFWWIGGVADDFTTGDVIKVLIGDSDNDGTGGYSGKYPNTITDGVADENVNNPLLSTGYDHVDVDIDFNFNGNTETYSASYPLVDGGGEVTMTATNDSFITLALNNSNIDLGSMSKDTISSNDATTVTVETNVSDGYTLRYRSSEFSMGGQNVKVIAPLNSSVVQAGTEGWGINFRANSNGIGSQVTPAGDESSIEADYRTLDNYLTKTDGQFDTIATILAPAENVYTMSVVVGIAELTEAGSYSSTMAFNVYANF